MEKEGLLEIKGLSVWYTRSNPVISELNMTLKPHEIVGLIGLNGAGKTTLINTLTGIHESFTVNLACFNGSAVQFAGNAFKMKRYTVFSEDSSFGYFTFDEYINHVFKSYKRNMGSGLVKDLVSGFHFQENRSKLIKDLSTGNKRKVFLITGFALRPELFLLDEPVNGLDFESTEFLYQLIREYKDHGTLLFSSHVLESICLTADRVIVLEGGAIKEEFRSGQISAENIREALRNDGDL